MKVFRGRLVHSVAYDKPVEVLEDTLIGFQDKPRGGKILFIEKSSELHYLSKKYGFDVHSVNVLSDREFLIPGFVDTHVHPHQYVLSGIGYDRQLYDWAMTYTIPMREKLKDLDYTRDLFTKAVKCFIRHGTTTACYFNSKYTEVTKELCTVLEKFGQRALVGVVFIDRIFPEQKKESTQQAIDGAKELVKFLFDKKNPLVSPIMTADLASCSYDLLKGFGDIVREYDIPTQSHLCEQQDFEHYLMSLFPQHQNTLHVFEDTGMLTNKTLMAHCIYLDESELQTMQKRDVGICHCPTSNFNLRSGNLDVCKLFEKGITKVGLGTDVSGGHSPSILTTMRSAIDTSRAVYLNKEDFKNGKINTCEKAISHHHAFYLATLGGAKVLSMDDKIGNFVVGKEFDALLIDMDAPDPINPSIDIFIHESFENVFMKFIYLGDDRNIKKRFVAGQEILL